MTWIDNIWIIDHSKTTISPTWFSDRLAAYLLSESFSIVLTSQLETQKKALYNLFDNAENVVKQKNVVEEFVKNNTLNQSQISILGEFTLGIVSLWLSIDSIDYKEDCVHITIIHNDSTMKLQIDADWRVHTSFNQWSYSSRSLQDGRLPNKYIPSFDAYIQKEFEFNK